MNKIYVGNLPFQVTEDQLRPIFSAHGEIRGIELIKDRETGTLRGFGFIEYASEEQAKSALILNGHQLNGKTLKVNIAQERERRSGGGGGRPGGGGGRNGNRSFSGFGGGRRNDDRGGRR